MPSGYYLVAPSPIQRPPLHLMRNSSDLLFLKNIPTVVYANTVVESARIILAQTFQTIIQSRRHEKRHEKRYDQLKRGLRAEDHCMSILIASHFDVDALIQQQKPLILFSHEYWTSSIESFISPHANGNTCTYIYIHSSPIKISLNYNISRYIKLYYSVFEIKLELLLECICYQ